MPSTSNTADIAKLVSQDYSFTQVLGLALYGDKSPADLRNGHNFNMRQIEENYNEIKVTGDTAIAILKAFGLTTEDAARTLRTSVDKSVDNAQAALERLEAMQVMSKDDAVTLARKVNQSASSLETLGADTDANAKALKENIDAKAKADDVYTKSEADARFKRSTGHNIVMLGDSWTTEQSQLLPKTLAAMTGVNYVKNYGVAGKVIQDLPSQASTAVSDSSIDVSKVTDVVVVCGTNNVYWDHPISDAQAKTAWDGVVSAFPYSVIHYFPDNARTNNGGRNSRYRTIIRAAINTGRVIVHPEYLYLTYGHNFEYYFGNASEYEVQHLNISGFQQLARWIAASINGADLTQLTSSFEVTPFFDASSEMESGSTLSPATISYYPDGFRVRMTLSGLKYKSTTSAERQKSPKAVFGFSLAQTGDALPFAWSSTNSPCNVNGADYARTYMGYWHQTSTSELFELQLPTQSGPWQFSQILVDNYFPYNHVNGV